MPIQPRESDTEEDDDRKVADRLKRPERDDADEYAEPQRTSKPSGDDEEIELEDDDIMEELSEDDLHLMEGPDA
jgi:hypothetical protein